MMREAGHIEVDVECLGESARFYDRVAGPLGWSRRFSGAHAVLWGSPCGTTGLAVIGPIEREEALFRRGPAGIVFARRRQLERIAVVAPGFVTCSRHDPYFGSLKDLDGNELLLVENPASGPRGLSLAVPFTEVSLPPLIDSVSPIAAIDVG